MTSLGVAVVTGGSGLIGRAVCRALVEAGHSVVAVDRNAAALAELSIAIPHDLTVVEADVTDHEQTEQIWRDAAWAAEARSLVCVAGGNTIPSQPAEQVRPEAFEAVVALNLTAAWKWCAEATPYLRRHGDGRVVLFSSASVMGQSPTGLAPYVAAKAGVIGLTRVLSRELGTDSVTVNCVCPGYVPDLLGVKGDRARMIPDEQRQEFLERSRATQSVQADCEPDDVAYAVRYLLSPEAKMVTGQIMHVNGGSIFGS